MPNVCCGIIIRIGRKNESSWSAVERRANSELKRDSALQGIGALVLACVGIGLGLKIVAGVKNIEERYEEGLNNQTCTGEVVDKTYTPEHEELSLIGRTPVLSKVPENRTITMQLGVGCRPYRAGDEIEINTDSQLWDKANNGDTLYHPGGSTDWDIYDDSGIPMGDLPASKSNESIEPAASEFYISPQALEEIASN